MHNRTCYRRFTLTIALLLALLAAGLSGAAAQSQATRLTELAVELWPDYDRPSMLVLLSGRLPADAALPATLSIPVPAGAEIHAVARFNEANALISDVTYDVENGLLTLTTPSDSFRVEYYAPYEADGNTYTYRFEWTSDLAVDSLATVVQQPLAATDIRITPQPASSGVERGDGLTYHTLAPRPVGAGEPFVVEVSYTVEAPVLSAPSQSLPESSGSPAPATDSAGGAVGYGISPWWLALGALVVAALIGGAWHLGRRQGTATRRRKPQPNRPPKQNSKAAPAAARYCHNCGQPAQAGDVFCRACGTPLKKE